MSNLRSGFESSEQVLEMLVVDEVGRGVEERLDKASDVAARVGRVLGDSDIDRDDVRLALARDLFAQEPLLERVGIYSTSRARIDEMVRGNVSGFLLPAELPTGADETTGWISDSKSAARKQFRFLAPIGKGGEVRGWVLAQLSNDVLEAWVEQVSVTVTGERSSKSEGESSQGYASVFDSDLNLVAGRSAEPITRPFLLKVSRPSIAGATLSVSQLSVDDKTVNGAVRRLARRPWLVAVARPEAKAFPQLFQARREFVSALSVLAACAILMSIWAATRTTRPIRDLLLLTKDYAARKFGTRSIVRTGDELEELGQGLQDMADALKESELEMARRARVEASLARYMPEEIAQAIAAGKANLDLGGLRRPIAVLFVDLVAFTSFASRSEPEVIVRFLNELFGVLTELVFRHHGIVDKFMGDSMMATFGAAGDPASTAAERAAACAEDMQRFAESLHDGWLRTYDFDVRLGIGLTFGEVVVGNLGTDKRMEFTAIGDSVNLAARLEDLARPGQILCSAELVSAATARFPFRSLGVHSIRGRKDPLELYELQS